MKADMMKPKKLQPGDKIATVSLSWGGPGVFPYRYEAGKRQLQDEFGVTVVEMPHTLSDASWLQRNPRARADDLMQAFADPSIKAIISTIGGDDSIRLLPFLDLDVIRSNPKIFMGYSDTTVTHLACLKAGLVSFYGPSIMAGFAENGGMLSYMAASVRKTLFSSAPIGSIAPNTEGWTVEFLDWAELENQTRKRKLTPSTRNSSQSSKVQLPIEGSWSNPEAAARQGLAPDAAIAARNRQPHALYRSKSLCA